MTAGRISSSLGSRRCRIAHALGDADAVADLARSLPDAIGLTAFGDWDTTIDDTSPPTVLFADLELGAGALEGEGDSRRQLPPTVFVTDGTIEAEAWVKLNRIKGRRLIDTTLLGDPRCVESAIRCALADPWYFDPACWGSGSDPTTTEIGSSDDRNRLIDDLIAGLDRHPTWSPSVELHRLVVEELVNNALLHAFEADEGHRYVPGSFTELLNGNRVATRHSIGDDAFWLSVSDNAGSLDDETVRGRILRHLNTDGLLDDGGRGIFIAFALANVFSVNLDRGRSTEVAVVFLPHRRADSKLMMINAMPGG